MANKFLWEDRPNERPTVDRTFASLEELPESVVRRLDRKQQIRWMLVANRAFVQATGDHQSRRAEAIREANAKVG
jgi:cation transport regulator ChaB